MRNLENQPVGSAAGTTKPRPSQRSLRWARVREIGEAILAGGDDAARIAEQTRELIGVLHWLEERSLGPGRMLLALVQKTGSTADRPGEPRCRDARDRWLEATVDDLEEVRARLAEVLASRLGEEFE